MKSTEEKDDTYVTQEEEETARDLKEKEEKTLR